VKKTYSIIYIGSRSTIEQTLLIFTTYGNLKINR